MAILATCFRPHGRGPAGRRVMVGRWAPVVGASVGEEVVVTVDRSLSSDVIEIHCHGGEAAPAHVLDGLVRGGARRVDWRDWLAHVGESTIAIEARDALCRVGGSKGAAILGRQFAGALDRAFDELRNLVAVDPDGARTLGARLLAASTTGLRLVDPWRVLVTGYVNVGKSSLVNALAGHPRALVSPEAGTTRDLLPTRVVLEGWEIDVIDSAGLRSDDGPVPATERGGIAAARRAAMHADLVLRVHPVDLPHLPARQAGEILVLSKADLGGTPVVDALLTSATTGLGIDALARAIVDRLVPSERHDPDLLAGAVPFTRRQVEAIERLVASLRDAGHAPPRHSVAPDRPWVRADDGGDPVQ